ncbi:MAG: CRISPR-associated helicase Cas3' [Tissierellia bacterium]|nr:CRISPR-associated helicase Cas3' [Tissierellia bacterium]
MILIIEIDNISRGVNLKDIFWAKKSYVNGQYFWLPLMEHLKDTRFVMGRLWELWLDEGQRRMIEEALSGENNSGKDLAMFLATVHDIGKCSPVFQSQESYNMTSDIDDLLIEKLEIHGFSELSNLFLADRHATHHSKLGQLLLEVFGVLEDISSIVGAHHGKPIAEHEKVISLASSYENNIYQRSSGKKVESLWKSYQKGIFDWALKINNYEGVDKLPRVKQNAQVILSGLLIMADWIASNEKYFPLISIDSDGVLDRGERERNGWTSWFKTHTWESDELNKTEIYYKRFGFENPRSTQKIFMDIVETCQNPGIFIFEAPMGLGKTEAALVAVEQLAYKMNKSGMFFGLPTQATSNAIFSRIARWLGSVSQDYGESLPIRLSHGKSELNEDFRYIKNNIEIESGLEGSLIVNQWFSGRKTVALDDFVIGTIDQFLMMALKQKHLFLRHLGFSKKVVVIDEVHAYDEFSSEYLYRALSWLSFYNVPVVILSATLPSSKRRDLIKAYLNGKTREIDVKTDAYPLVTYTDGTDIRQFSNFEKQSDRAYEIIKKSPEEIMDLVEEISNQGGNIGIIVNTVKKAQELTKLLINQYGKDKVFLLHSAFISSHRSEKERELLYMIGKDASRPEFKIIIGTQVMEQSLDIDFDVLITDLAPMDLLIQRIGRLHRHEIKRPDFHKQARVYVLGTDKELDFEEGTSHIYHPYILTRTQYFLPDRIIIPSDISFLVQQVYGDDEIELGDKDDLYQTYKSSYIAYKREKEDRAKVYLLSKPKQKKRRLGINSIKGWLDWDNDSKKRSEEEIMAQVRDIESTIEVIALKKVGRGYGFFESKEDISKEIGDYKLSLNIGQSTIKLPRILSQNYNIDKTIKSLEEYNLSQLKNWQQDPWLKGSLGIIFDENNEFIINGVRLKYSLEYGLEYERIKDE